MFTTPVSPRTTAQRLGIHAILLVGSVLFIFPFYWLVTSSVKPIEDVMVFPPKWVPDPWYTPWEWHWGNFREALDYIPFFTYLKNTLIVCILGVMGTVLANALVAYGFARIEWPGRGGAFILTLSTMMLPFPVVMVPLFTVFRELHWIGTLKPLWVPAWFGSAFNIFLLRQFFRTIPADLSDAGRIDGCSEFGIFSRIIVPLSKPALAVVGLFHFLWAWNDFLGPLIYLTRQETFTLSLGLQFYLSQQGGNQWHYLMAASTLVILPIIILFFFTQRALIRGISMTGLKG
jgi:multiple sugar transport system permease protein